MYKDNMETPLWEQAEARLGSVEQEFEPSSVISQEEAIDLQMLRPEQQQESSEEINIGEEREYEKLSIPQTLGDIGKSMGAEVLRVFAPEQNSKASQFLGGYSEDNLWQYKPKTRVAEGIKTLQHYLGGTLAIMATAEVTGGASVYLGGAKNIQGLVKGGELLKKAFGATAFVQNVGKGRLINALAQGEGAGILADFILEDGESRIANAFGTVSTPIIGDFVRWMQDDGTDTRLERGLKNVVEGRIVSLFANPAMEYLAKPVAEATFKQLRAMKTLSKTDIEQGTEESLNNFNSATLELNSILNKADLIQNVEEIYQKALKEGTDGTQIIHDTFPNETVSEALDLYHLYQQGEKPFLHQDGTWDIKVTNSWTDAYKVSPEEYQKQLLESDSSGLLGIQHQNQAIKDTWIKRGWLGSDAELTKESARSIAKEYQNKWGLSKAPKIEFIDGNGALQKSVEGTTTASGVIKIDKNAKYPYATLRAELEHYRDRINKTVPKNAETDGSGVHFSRYTGDNETEVAPFYTHKKAQGRQKALELEQYQPISKEQLDDYTINTSKDTSFGENPDVNEADYTPYTIHTIYDNKGNNLAHLRITDGNYIQWRYNTQIEKGAARKLIAKLLYNNQYQTLVWEATTENSVKSYERFLREFPDLADRIQFTDKYHNVDIGIPSNYTQGKGVSNETSHSNNTLSQRGQVLSGNNITDNSETLSGVGQNQRTNRADKSGVLLEGNSTTHERGSITNSDYEIGLQGGEGYPAQLTLDFNTSVNTKQTPEELRNSVVSGEIKPTTTEEVGLILTKTIELDPNLANLTKADADVDKNFQAKLQEGYYKDAFLRNDPDELAAIYQREKAVASIIDEAFKKVKEMDEPTELFDSVLDTIDKYGKYIDLVAHYSGVGLQQHKQIKEMLNQSWGSKRAYDSLKAGLDDFTKLLDEEFEKYNLNFTTGTVKDPKEIKQQVINTLFAKDSQVLNDLLFDENFTEIFSKQVDLMFRNNLPFNPQSFKEEMLKALQTSAREDMLHALKLAPNAEAAKKTVMGAKLKNGKLEEWYINNLLSSPRTPIISWVSGALNSLYFPARKYIQGLDVGGLIQDKALGWLPKYTKVYSPNASLTAEAAETYKGLMMNWGESWSLAKEAFINGEGKFISMKKDASQLAEGVQGFDMKAWNDPNATVSDKIMNTVWSMCRALGASDEQLSQLNYRAITRAKALEMTNKLTNEYGITNEALKHKIFQKRFDAGFTKDGKPTDIKTYYEVREMLYQTELDGSIKLPDSNEKTFVREQTNIMKAGKALQDLSNKNTCSKMLLPFVRTGANIVNMALEHNHLYSLLSSSQRKLLFSKTTEGAKARSQVMFGYLSLGFASLLAAGGLITGSAPANTKEREALYKAGWQPYSIRIGDKYLSYSGIEPLHGMFGFAADWANLCTSVQNQEDETSLTQFFLQSSGIVAANFLEKAAFRNAIDFMSIVLAPTSQSEEQVMRFLGQKTQGLLPASAAVRGTVGSLGKTSKRKQDTFAEGLLTKYFNRGLGEYKRDAFGNRMDMFGALITNVTWTGTEPEEVELARLAEQGWSPSEITKNIANGGSLKLTDFTLPSTNQNGYDLLQEILSTSGLRESVRELVQSEEYLSIEDDGINTKQTAQLGVKYTDSSYTKVNRLKEEWAVFGSDAKADLMEAYGDTLINKQGETLKEYVLKIERINQAAKTMPLSQINELY